MIPGRPAVLGMDETRDIHIHDYAENLTYCYLLLLKIWENK